MGRSTCELIRDFLAKTLGCIQSDLEDSFPICSSLVNVCNIQDDEDAQPSQPSQPSQSARPVQPLQPLNPIVVPDYVSGESPEKEESGLFYSEKEIEDVYRNQDQTIINDIKENRDFYLSLLSSFNSVPGIYGDRRVFREIHQYDQSDPHLTIGFGHFANGSETTFFSDMPEGTKTLLCNELAKRLLEKEDYFKQFQEDFKDLFRKDSKATFSRSKQDVLEREISSFFSKEGALKDDRNVNILGTMHTGLAAWADDRIFHYRNSNYPTYDYTVKSFGKGEDRTVSVNSISKERYDYINKKIGYQQSSNGLFRKVVKDNYEPFYLYQGHCHDDDESPSIDIKVTGAKLFPGDKDTSGYWFYDLLREVLLHRKIAEWQIYIWWKTQLAVVRTVAKNQLVNLSTNKGAMAAMASWKNTGYDFGEPLVKNVVCGLKDEKSKINTHLNVFSHSVNIDSVYCRPNIGGEYAKCSLESFSKTKNGFVLKEDGPYRRIINTDVFVDQSKCVKVNDDSEGKPLNCYIIKWRFVPRAERLVHVIAYDKDKKQIINLPKDNEDVVFFECSNKLYKKGSTGLFEENVGGTHRQVVGTDLYIEKKQCIVNDSIYLIEWEKCDELRVMGVFPMFSINDDNKVYVECSQEQYVKSNGNYVLESHGDSKTCYRRVCGSRLYIDSNRCNQREGRYFLSIEDKDFVLSRFYFDRFECFTKPGTIAVSRKEKGLYFKVDDYHFRKENDSYSQEDSSTGNYRRLEGTSVFVEDIDCLDLGGQSYYKADDSVEFTKAGCVKFKVIDSKTGQEVLENRDCYRVEINSRKLLVDYPTVSTSFREDIGGPYVCLNGANSSEVIGIDGVIKLENAKNSPSDYASFRPGDKSSAISSPDYQSDLKALRIWLYYNKRRIEKEPEFRSRQLKIYEYWFLKSWGELPKVDSDWETIKTVTKKRKNKTTTKTQKYSLLNTRYAYLEKMSKKEDHFDNIFSWGSLKECLNITSEDLKKL